MSAEVYQQTIFKIQVAASAGGQPANGVEAAKRLAAGLLRAQGYRVMPGQRGRPYLWYTDGDRVAGVEVRRAFNRRGSARGQYNRYQVPIKGHQQAQLLLLLAIAADGQEYPFLIPMAEIGARRNIALWSENPADYSGQWAPYLNNWDILAQVLAEAPTGQNWGLALFK